jgi:tRNA-2-methylthio-N6-dimethylallyladenosine synthase
VLAKQIHLPLQSGDEKVLIHMNRNHSMARYREIVQNIRRILPTATLFTDIIVGFSGETEEQFQNTAQAMEEFRYQMAFIAQYSPRPGAASSRWADDISSEEKKRRFHILSTILQKHSLEYNQSLIGRKVRVLVERADRKQGYLSGRTEGKTLIRFPSQDHSLIGQFIDLEVTSAVALSMEGQLVESSKSAARV